MRSLLAPLRFYKRLGGLTELVYAENIHRFAFSFARVRYRISSAEHGHASVSVNYSVALTEVCLCSDRGSLTAEYVSVPH
jgi:hypothetical protein